MPPKKAQKAEAGAQEARPSRKRQLPIDPYEVPDETAPSKRQRRSNPAKQNNEKQDEPVVNGTPSKRRGRPPKAEATTPSAQRQKDAVETPVKFNGINGASTPGRKTIADRSARKKSARALVDRIINGAISDDEAEDGDIAREIYESSEEELDEEDENQESQEATTPSKTGRKPKATTNTTRTRKRSPTPPGNLPPHEQYFYQNKPGRAKTSNNTLSSLDLLTHDEYFSILRKLKDPHEADVNFLLSLHAESFPQWAFELSQGFSTCLYGYGSKRKLLHNFATYLSTSSSQPPSHRIVVINGYVRTLTAREILSTLSTAILSPSKGGLTTSPTLATLLSLLSSSSSPSPVTLTILINSIDSPPLRKQPLQALLATLSSHPQIRLCCTADSPDFPLLWDSAIRSSFNFIFHDCTTFSRFSPAELEVVDEVHELLNRKTRRVGGKEGVAFVLRSLPENAKNLFRLLVGEVLVAMEEQQSGGAAADDEVAVEYRMVYQKAVEEFICSSEMAFRTLLKEFHDHQIITSHKDALGTELLSLPFRKDELESILEELMS
ncbi:hypothetical protein QBC43DRAFT_375568 [Cladorrhinum sp. PSN259]|nr:hypothetical protein QBC43DRAFT_375568 [Cladorrhinum sp. PSN259]